MLSEMRGQGLLLKWGCEFIDQYGFIYLKCHCCSDPLLSVRFSPDNLMNGFCSKGLQTICDIKLT